VFWTYTIFLAIVAVMLALDLGVFHRKAKAESTATALRWSFVWISLGVAFAGLVYLGYEYRWGGLGEHAGSHEGGLEAAGTYLTAYLIEKSLATDNLFVIAMIFTSFKIPRAQQHRVLFWGIVGAVVMRGAMIYAGTALVQRFEWMLVVFGLFLIYTAIKMLKGGEEDAPEPEKNRAVRRLSKVLRVDFAEERPRFFVRTDGKLRGTPLLLALLTVEGADVIFAVDSIPAIFGITTDPFIVFSSNIMAILGLRSLFFVLASLMERFSGVKTGVSIVLIVVGLKMVTHHWVEQWLGVDNMGIMNWVMLGLVLGILGFSGWWSYRKSKQEGPAAHEHHVPPVVDAVEHVKNPPSEESV
jgi:tellurite resistance protein TerC